MKRELKSLHWLVLGSLLMLVSNGRWIIPVAAWIYPVFLLIFMHSQKPWRGFATLFPLSGLINIVAWWKMMPLPGPFYFFTLGFVLNLFITLPFFLDRILRSRLRGFKSTLLFPLAWVSLEFLHNLLFRKGSWISIAYTQFENLSFLQLVSITGISGISFFIGWFASVVYWIREQGFEWKKIRSGSITFASILCLVFLVGYIRIHFTSNHGTLRVAAIVQARRINAELASCKWTDAPAISSFSNDVTKNLLDKTREAAEAGAKMILWQESAGFLPKKEEKDFIARARELASSEKIYLLMTLWSVPEDYPNHLVENKLILIDPDGRQPFTYFKSNPAPPEPILKGNGNIPVFETEFGRISAAICYDADFPRFIRQAGNNGTDIMFIPANDWKEIDPMHTHMAVVRAIENGFSLVHPAGQGLSVATDNKGRIISSLDYFQSDEQILYGDVPLKHTKTLYAQLGDWFALVCLALFVSFSCYSFLEYVRNSSTHHVLVKNSSAVISNG